MKVKPIDLLKIFVLAIKHPSVTASHSNEEHLHLWGVCCAFTLSLLLLIIYKVFQRLMDLLE